MEKTHVLIVGLGVSGVAACRYFAKQDVRITVTDMKKPKDLSFFMDQLQGIDVTYKLGQQTAEVFLSADLIVLSPGVSTSLDFVQQARDKGIRITSEAAIALSLIKTPVIGVTGTNGKTTTTTLIGEMLAADQVKVFVGGNIGKPLLDYVLEDIKADVVVAELSSFQLETIESFTPAVAVFTNIEPDHLDRYSDFSAYVHAKKRMLFLSDEKTGVVINADNPVTAEFANEKKGALYLFSLLRNDVPQGALIQKEEKRILVKTASAGVTKTICFDVAGFRCFGLHNKENLAAAICAALHMGVSEEAIKKVITDFQGVEHRLEFVRKKDGVFFINDSKGTNVNAVEKSLQSFPHNPMILIAGGKDKGADFSVLSSLVRERVKVLVLVGEAKEAINRAIGDDTETYIVGTFDEAVLLSFQKSRRGDIVMLSPGCASFDMFKNYEERGKYYKKLVSEL
jgi:UDP-N-acetylmuramoylalanine--D-glutamate ligase